MNRHSFLFLVFIFGCAGPTNNIPTIVKTNSNAESHVNYISCTGKGRIDSQGPIQGKLSFSFISQHDSSFFQFKDPMGRKVLLMWLSPQNVSARNLIENKQYTYNQILDFFPFLQIVEPMDITKFLWGIQPDYDTKYKEANMDVAQNIQLKFEREERDLEPNLLVSATFVDNSISQSVFIEIKNRAYSNSLVNLKRVWKLLTL
ncbi:MAG: hypothetical protein HOB40_09395 [Candidatus Marinimicrobia bacterium]|jgi:hypothetical protein|nr:hypothetical protein [Candidatus Neomarinimicrobiota bacterium]MBT3500907.1 hypothetical protein [Candidatus Neomarinimicrobiota bacterium]MBT3840098.1 hypothetical protein [Candidatus Neomarinimicrobiota bacterium]MBT3999933.1 hypothetical protein [Candidatus Neomarinimicrobiota bacterium]MBT4282983.1 hypothetical protein [Candidatus Neomarinimicrobiota bacterium]